MVVCVAVLSAAESLELQLYHTGGTRAGTGGGLRGYDDRLRHLLHCRRARSRNIRL